MAERRLRVLENSVLRRIFGPKKNEIIEFCRKLLHEELNKLCSLKSIISINKTRMMMIWARP
jgi:hypothetical protein